MKWYFLFTFYLFSVNTFSASTKAYYCVLLWQNFHLGFSNNTEIMFDFNEQFETTVWNNHTHTHTHTQSVDVFFHHDPGPVCTRQKQRWSFFVGENIVSYWFSDNPRLTPLLQNLPTNRLYVCVLYVWIWLVQ